MRSQLLVAAVVALCTACSDEPRRPKPVPPSSGQEFVYRGLVVDVGHHWVRRILSPEDGSRITGESEWDACIDVFDPEGRLADTIWRKHRSNKIYLWEQFKLLATTPEGSLVLRLPFSPSIPGGYRPSIEIAENLGETPRQDHVVPESPVEGSYLVYVFRGAIWCMAAYGQDGRWVHGEHGYPNGSTIGSGLEVPDEFDAMAVVPPIADRQRFWPEAAEDRRALVCAFLVRQYDEGRLFTVAGAEPDRRPMPARVIRFAQRPYDRMASAIQDHGTRDLLEKFRVKAAWEPK